MAPSLTQVPRTIPTASFASCCPETRIDSSPATARPYSFEMKQSISPTLRRILEDTRREIEQDKSRASTKRLKQKIRDAVPLLSFASALSAGKALIGEIKEKSPSQGKMRRENVTEAARQYK